MPITVTCPYCNAPVPVADAVPLGGRVSCPRCEETVTVRDAGTSTPDAASVEPPAGPLRASNRAIAGLMVAVMVGMAAFGLSFALRTQAFRRANDVKGVQEPGPAAETRPVPPAEWPGLGYLPDDVQAVAGVRVAAALESAAGRTLLGALG